MAAQPTASDIQQAIERALEHHGAGRLAEAERLYRGVLESRPDHAEALHLLGVVALQSGDPGRAAGLIERALQAGPPNADHHNNLGEAYRGLGRAADAERCYRAALALEPSYPEAHNNLGNALKDLGRPEEAEASYRRALKINPRYAQAHYNLANLLHDQERLADAERGFRAALAIVPDMAEVHNGLGCVLAQGGKPKDAEQEFRRALALNADYAEAHANLGVVLRILGRTRDAEQSCRQALSLQPGLALTHFNLGKVFASEGLHAQAETSYRKALTLDPKLAEAHYSLGNALRDLGRMDESEQCFRRVLELKPRNSEAYHNLGNVLQGLGRLADAEQCLRRALAINPRFAEAHANLGRVFGELGHLEEAERCLRRAIKIDPGMADAHAILGSVLRDLGRRPEAERCLRRALKLKPGLPSAHIALGGVMQSLGRLEEAERSFREAMSAGSGYEVAHSNLIFLLDMMKDRSLEEQQEERRRWYAKFGRKHAVAIRPHGNLPDPERRLRVGYVSGDFRQHSACTIFSPILRAHDRAGFEVFCYSEVRKEDDLTEELRKVAQVWRCTVGVSDDALTELIRRDEIDILVDLSGHTAHNRLQTFVRKPAPVQVTAWGHSTGTGIETIDYFLADPVLVPPQERALYAEEVVDLPCCVCYEPPNFLPELSMLPALAGKCFTFGCINRLEKISDTAIALWSRILAALPESRLLVKALGLEDSTIAESLLRRIRNAGIRPDRVTFKGPTSRVEHLRAFHEVDLALDPFPHGGGVSTVEALWMGVPVVTLQGSTTASRLSASILTAAEMPEWIARSDEEYVRLAIEAAQDLPRLASLRQGLRAHMNASVIGDTQRYTRAVEAAYRSMWRRWCDSVTGQAGPAADPATTESSK